MLINLLQTLNETLNGNSTLSSSVGEACPGQNDLLTTCVTSAVISAASLYIYHLFCQRPTASIAPNRTIYIRFEETDGAEVPVISVNLGENHKTRNALS